jgi:hypothetical protein
MLKLNSQKTYCLATGIILFILGFFGFAFPGIFNLPGSYLIASLILGFWGIVVGSKK